MDNVIKQFFIANNLPYKANCTNESIFGMQYECVNIEHNACSVCKYSKPIYHISSDTLLKLIAIALSHGMKIDKAQYSVDAIEYLTLLFLTANIYDEVKQLWN